MGTEVDAGTYFVAISLTFFALLAFVHDFRRRRNRR